MGNATECTVILGDEFDDELRARLLEIFHSLGSTSSEGERSLAGSQEIETYTVTIRDMEIRVEAETYVGLKVTGPIDLIARIQQMLGQKSASGD